MKFDEKIVEMIRDLFKNLIDCVNGICFVASASSPRLTATQKYIFSSVVSLFDNDIPRILFSCSHFVMVNNLKCWHLY